MGRKQNSGNLNHKERTINIDLIFCFKLERFDKRAVSSFSCSLISLEVVEEAVEDGRKLPRNGDLSSLDMYFCHFLIISLQIGLNIKNILLPTFVLSSFDLIVLLVWLFWSYYLYWSFILRVFSIHESFFRPDIIIPMNDANSLYSESLFIICYPAQFITF